MEKYCFPQKVLQKAHTFRNSTKYVFFIILLVGFVLSANTLVSAQHYYFENTSDNWDKNGFASGKTANVNLDNFSDQPIFRGKSLMPKNSAGFRIWGDFYYDWTDISPKDVPGVKADELGGIFGLDIKKRNGSVFGLFYHYGSNDMKWNSDLFKLDDSLTGKTTNHQFGLSFNKPLPLSHFLVIASGGFDKYGFKYLESGASNEINLDTDGIQANVYGEFGLDIPIKSFGIKPFWGLHYHFLKYDEVGAGTSFANSFHGDDYHGLNNLLGVRLSMKMFNGFLTTQFRGTWVHEYLETSPTYQSYFSSIPTLYSPVRWNVEGDTARDWAWIGAGVKLNFGKVLLLFADYDLMINERQTSHVASLSLCLGW
ncbi:MAG: autotransporter outer membrane beta-barrel domain-containing protein [Thermoguttaceae bacterium]